MLSNIGPTELIIIGVVLVILFGSKKITEVAGTLGKTSKELKKVKEEYNKVLSGERNEPVAEKPSENGNNSKKEVETDA